MSLPNDPVILLSYVNTQLRDFYPSLSDFCEAFDVSEEEIKSKLSDIDYEYDDKENRFC